ncbi:MAG: ATP-binding protein [Verrucomicrobiota bacterium]
MLARRLATILPPLTPEEALETAKTHCIVGLLAPGQALVIQRPLCRGGSRCGRWPRAIDLRPRRVGRRFGCAAQRSWKGRERARAWRRGG